MILGHPSAMYMFLLLFVLLSLPAATVAASQTYHGDVTPHQSLGDRMERLERLLLLQHEELQAEKLKTERMKLEFEAKNERMKHQFEAKTEHIKYVFETRLRDLNTQWESRHSQCQHKMELTRSINSLLEGELAILKTEWSEKQKQWDAEKQPLHHDLDRLRVKLKDKLNEQSVTTPHVSSDEIVPLSSVRMSDTGNGAGASGMRIRPVRADDTDPLAHVVSQMSQRLTEMNADIQALQVAVQEAGRSVYVHWGSSTCPASNSLVYSGVMGGSARDEDVSNYLCLTMSPVLSNHAIPGESVAHLYGSEYQTEDSYDNKDAVCAVCRAPRSTTVMIPGTNVCEAGWRKEYSGFLMADYYPRHVATEYICVDSKLESRVASSDHLEGKMLFFTVTRCGSLPCDPYVNNTIVTCVVCSK